MNISDSELKILEIIWDKNHVNENEEITAKELSDLLMEKYGWSKNANYVYFRRLLEKKAISRRYPNYTIKALVKKEDIVNNELDKIINRNFGGSFLSFFSTFLNDKKVTDKDIKEMKEILESYEKKDNKKSRE